MFSSISSRVPAPALLQYWSLQRLGRVRTKTTESTHGAVNPWLVDVRVANDLYSPSLFCAREHVRQLFNAPSEFRGVISERAC